MLDADDATEAGIAMMYTRKIMMAVTMAVIFKASDILPSTLARPGFPLLSTCLAYK